IMPETFQPKQNSILYASFTSGHNYFESEEIPDITKFRMLFITPKGQEIPLSYSRVGPEAACAAVPISGEGTYVVGAVSTMPNYWCKTTEGWKPGKKSALNNVVKGGVYVKSIKTFLTTGRPSTSYKKILGHTIEIVPQENPSNCRAGQEIPVLVMYHGTPVKDVEVFGIYEGYKSKDHSDQPVKTKTNENGIAKVKVGRTGKWVIFAKHKFDTPKDPNTDYENYRAYMMFEIRKQKE
ncbi:MAG: DUF4198 domain-containing protein, partial [Thermodesulfobacteriota bacterium]|nr:DUF4198 domain-containing protein [Thermodesulfobacteriota bacterium]